MWATNYKTDNNLSIPFPGILSDGRLFTEYNADSRINDSIKKNNNIKSNSEYRKFLVQNTNSIIQYNLNNTMLENKTYVPGVPTYGTPYLFKSMDDDTIPYGYETSHPKMMYLSRQQLDDKKRRPMQTGYE
jgi:hypothetical protein